MTNPIDTGIPMLTEVIPAPCVGNAPEFRSAPPIPTIAGLAVKDEMAPEKMPAAPAWDEGQLQQLEHEIRERVLYQVLERIDFVLEQRVRDSLADVLQTAVEDLAREIKDGLHHSIRDVVTRAVTQEITKLQSAKK